MEKSVNNSGKSVTIIKNNSAFIIFNNNRKKKIGK